MPHDPPQTTDGNELRLAAVHCMQYGRSARNSRGMVASGTIASSQTQTKSERLQQPVQRGLRRVVLRMNRTENVRARHPRLLRELLDSHRSNDLPESDLEWHALVHGQQAETGVRIPDRGDPAPALRSSLD